MTDSLNDSIYPEGAARFAELVPGRRYRVQFNDEVHGHFEAVFERLVLVPDDEGGEFVDAAVFDTARIGPTWGNISWTALG